VTEPAQRRTAARRAAQPDRTGTFAEDTRTGGAAVQADAGTGAAAGRTGAAGSAAEEGAPAQGMKSTGMKSTGMKSTGRKSTGRKSTGKKAGAARAAKQTGATTVVAKKTPGTATAAKSAVPKARFAGVVEPGDLAVRPGEDPWTAEEVAEARALLQSEMERLRSELSSSAASLAGLMRDSGDGAGDDQADTGTKNITREHEMALAANARETLTQTERALDELDAGTYGLCENCGNPIGKARMQAFPRATLCVECKQKQERR
jgi:RNA polymerase-binding protein DksA